MAASLSQDAESIQKFSSWFIAYGVILIILGAIAIIVPGIATLAVELLVAWLLLIGGVFGIVATIAGGSSAPGFWWNLITAIVYVLAGAALLWSPIAGAVTLTIIVAAYLFAAGLAKIVFSVQHRGSMRSAWGWTLLSGIIDVALGALIVLGLPLTGLWVLGLMVGVSLVVTGAAMIMLAVQARRLPAPEQDAEAA